MRSPARVPKPVSRLFGFQHRAFSSYPMIMILPDYLNDVISYSQSCLEYFFLSFHLKNRNKTVFKNTEE